MSKRTKTLLIIIPVLLLLCCGVPTALLVFGGAWAGQALESSFVESPEEAAAVGQSIIDYRLPPGYQEQGAMSMLGNSMVFIAPTSGQGGMVFVLAEFNPMLINNEEEMRQQVQDALANQESQSGGVTFSPVSSEEITINGAPTTLAIAEGTDESGNPVRQANATFRSEDALGMLLIMGDPATWDEAAVDMFLDSIR